MARKPATAIACLLIAGAALLPGAAPASSDGAVAGASAKGGGLVNQLARGACKAERSDVGKRGFRKRYGRRAMKVCVKRARPQARSAVREATAECEWELDEYGAEEFLWEWDSFEACVADYAGWIMDGGSFEEDEGDEPDEDWEDEGGDSDEGEDDPGEGGEDPGEGGEEEPGDGGDGGGTGAE